MAVPPYLGGESGDGGRPVVRVDAVRLAPRARVGIRAGAVDDESVVERAVGWAGRVARAAALERRRQPPPPVGGPARRMPPVAVR